MKQGGARNAAATKPPAAAAPDRDQLDQAAAGPQPSDAAEPQPFDAPNAKPFDAPIRPFDMAIQPFYPDLDESQLANVALRLPDNRRIERRQRQRVAAMLTKTRSAARTIERLPGREQSLHCILNGEFALFDFIPAILQLAGQPIDALHIATLGFSRKNVEALGQLIDAGQVRQCAMLCSHFFAAQDKDIYSQAAELFAKHRLPIAAMRTHAKLLLIAVGDDRLVIESSANLRSCHNVEQATIFNDPPLFDFHRTWMDVLLAGGKPA